MAPIRQKQIPRGIRNNNPLNIRIGNVWLGEVTNPTDPEFEQFCTIEYGLRAACVLLRRYINHYKRKTITQIVAAWAPASENMTENYIKLVSEFSGIASDQVLSFEDEDSICRIVQAMCRVECGQIIKYETIVKGYRMS